MILAWIISLVTVAFLGYHWREINERLKIVEDFVKLKIIEKRKVEDDNPSSFLDPDDVATQAKREHERLLKGLNPDA